MLLARSIDSFPFDFVAAGSVATIGSYDGLHHGHQELLGHVLEHARANGLPSVVMSFEPTPKEFFAWAACFGRSAVSTKLQFLVFVAILT